MIKNAEKFREEDQKRRESIEIKNNLDSKIHSVEKTLHDNKSSLTEEIINNVEASLNEAKEVLKSDNIDHDRLK